jgi:hypothetical protein
MRGTFRYSFDRDRFGHAETGRQFKPDSAPAVDSFAG